MRMYFGELKKIKERLLQKGSFIQNVAIMFSSSAIGVVIQIIFTPILARIYTPETYGLYAVFAVIVSNLAAFTGLSYHEAILLPKNDKDVWRISKIVILQLVVLLLIVSLILAIWGKLIVKYFWGIAMPYWIWLILPAWVLTVLINIFNQINIRNKEFKKNASRNVINNIVNKSTSLSYGIVSNTVYGQILGSIIGATVALIGQAGKSGFLRIKKILTEIFSFRINDLKEVAKKYYEYPLFIFPSAWINQFSTQIPIIVFGFWFSKTEIGFYSFAMGLLMIPIGLIGNSIRPVFFQRALEIGRDRIVELSKFTTKTYRKLVLLGALPTAIMVVWGKNIFTLVFGNNWAVSGTIASYLGLFVFFQLISSPLTAVRRVTGGEKTLLYINIILLILRGSLIVFLMYNANFETAVLYYSLLNALFYFANSIEILHRVKANLIKEISFGLSVISFCILFCFMLSKLVLIF